MPFPESPRVVYQKNPLTEVICQLRFPAFLKIEAESPIGFQEEIRQTYPLFQEKAEMSIVLPQEIAQQLPPSISDSLRINKRAYDFISSDEEWVVTLTSGFLALTARKYKRWEMFKEHLLKPYEALLKQYSPAFFTRIGLRYVNIIRRSELGLQNLSWSQLLEPYIAGELNSPEVSGFVEQSSKTLVLRLQNNIGSVRIQHGLVKDEDDEINYLIDSDFFTDQRLEQNNVIDLLNQYHQQAGRLFRWCITPQLHEALEPQPIS